MAQKLTESVVRALPPPDAGNRILYDSEVRGFGCRVTYRGAKSYVLNFRSQGRERRLTIGSHPDWSLPAARDEAKRLKRQIDVGEDPMAARHAERQAPTVAEVAERFVKEHASTLRQNTRSDYESMLRLYVLPEWGRVRIESLEQGNLQRVHDRVAEKYPYRANRVINLLATMISWSGNRIDNPARKVKLAPEEERERFLTFPEIEAVCAALECLPNQVGADAIRLLLVTGARKLEVCGARWREFDLENGNWTRPAGRVKGKKRFSVPLSEVAILLLCGIRDEAKEVGRSVGDGDFVFPGSGAAGHLADIKSCWRSVTIKAGLGHFEHSIDGKGVCKRVWKSTVRPHDLRHTFASIAASGSHSLPIVGRLIGHRRPISTARYAHLTDQALRAAVNEVGVSVIGKRFERGVKR